MVVDDQRYLQDMATGSNPWYVLEDHEDTAEPVSHSDTPGQAPCYLEDGYWQGVWEQQVSTGRHVCE